MKTEKTILIVEDNNYNMKLIRDILTSQGYLLIEAFEGEQALNLALKHSNEIDLVLMDIQLPDINGLEVMEQLKQNKKTQDLPIYVISAYAMPTDIEKAQNAGCLEYITKPINLSEFIQKINLFFKTNETEMFKK